MGWLKPPPVIAVSGAIEFLRIREIRKAQVAAKRKKRRIEHVRGDDTGEIEKLIAGTVFFSDKLMIFVTQPSKLKPEFILAHHKSKDTSAVLVLHYEDHLKNNTKFFKLLDSNNIPHLTFASPKPWEVEGRAIKFVMSEAKRRKKVIPEDLARALVATCGDEYGFLSFEVLKLSTYLDALGETEVTRAHLRGLIAVLNEASVFPVVDALAAVNERALLRRMGAMERTHSGDPTMRVCAVLATSVASWLQAVSAVRGGLDSASAAQAIGASPGRMDKVLLPAGKRWGEKEMRKLLKEIAQVERAVKTGRSHPWVLLQSRLAASCRSRRAAG
jgi:DNA polymerase III delta subunit